MTMNCNRSTLVLALAGQLAWLAACEGEPPVLVPENPSMAGATVAAPATAPGAQGAENATAAAVAAPPATTSNTQATPPAAGAPASTAPVAGASATPAPTAPAESPHGNITGTITTKPAALAPLGVIYLEDAPKDDAPPPVAMTIDNRQMMFNPYVTVVSVGSKVLFVNSDPFPHNVFSPDGEKFNMGAIGQHGGRQHLMERPGPYTLLCNLHPGMLGYLFVAPTTYFARTDAKGHYTLKHVPAGTYRVSAWAPRQVTITQSVTVGEGDATVDFELHR